MLQPTFLEAPPHQMYLYGPMALSPLLWELEMQVSKRPAKDAHPPLCYLTHLAQSPLASQLSPLHWYMAWNGVTTILIKICQFQSTLALFSMAPAFLQPKSFWHIWDLDSFSSRVALSFQWLPRHPNNELADSLTKTGAKFPLSMFPTCWPWLLQRLDTVTTLFGDKSQLPLLPDSFGFLRGTGPSLFYPL